ncbi:MAG: 50S ribosomal protein L25/general stress protein Ctc [Desulfobacterales bacterium]
MELIELNANIRTTVGNGPARRLRQSGQLPAVLYGPGAEPVLLSVNISDFDQVLKKSGASQLLLNLVIQDDETHTRSAMVKELQTHPVSRDFLHVDFYEIAMDRKIKVKVPIVTTGMAKGVELGGVLQIVRREIEVLCLPFEVPESIEIDIADLDIGDSIHVGDISLEGEVELLGEENFTIVTLLSPKLEEEEEPTEEEEEEAEEAAVEGEVEEAPKAGDEE